MITLSACDNNDGDNDNPPAHTCLYNQEVIEDTYRASDATCDTKARYFYSCTCGEKGTETFEYGNFYHEENEFGNCKNCGRLIKSTDGVLFEISNDGTYAKVVGYIGSEKNVKIAGEYNNKPVRIIDNEAFCNLPITNIEIPLGITEIRESAFAYCWYLESVILPNTIISIGERSFNGCNSLESVIIPDSVKNIGAYSFMACDNLKFITIGNSVEKIEGGAFVHCEKLTEINYNAIDCKETSYAMFAYAGIETVGVTVKIGSTVEKIPNNLFYHDPSNGAIPKITNIIFEQGSNCEQIGYCAFRNCIYLETITIPNSVKNIGAFTFSLCNNLKNVTLGLGITKLEEGLFDGCVNLTNLILPSNITVIGREAFKGCSSLANIDIPDSVVNVEENAFDGCPCVAVVNGVKYVDNWVYEGNPSATTITINNNVKGIAYCAFENCSNLKEIYYNGSIKDWASKIKGLPYIMSYRDCPIGGTKLYIDNVETIEVILEDVPKISLYAFRKTNIVKAVINNGVECIGAYAFSYCNDLKELIISKSVRTIEEGAFFESNNLTKVFYMGTAEDWGKIEISTINNDTIVNMNVYYFSESKPEKDGNYWHYIDGEVVVWE